MPGPRVSSLNLPIVALFVGGYLYGWATGHLPASSDPDVFWIANFGAPYVVLPFAGSAWLVRTRAASLLASAVAGSAVGAGMVCGFYRLHAVGRDPNADPGFPESVAGAYRRWFTQFLLGIPGGAPWLGLALVLGAVAGLCAWLWLVRGSTVAGVAGVLPLFLESAYRFSVREDALPLFPGLPLSTRSALLWGCEALVGVVAFVLVVRHRPAAAGVGRMRAEVSRGPG